MQILLTAPALSGFSLDSIRAYVNSRIEKVVDVLPDFDGEHQVRISIQKERYLFNISVEISIPNTVFVTSTHKNIYAAIDDAVSTVKRVIRKSKEKKRE